MSANIPIRCPDCGDVSLKPDSFDKGRPVSGECPSCGDRLYFAPNDFTAAPVPIRIVSLDCWHSNELIYQADGRTEDGLYVHVHYRGGRFSIGVCTHDDESCPYKYHFFARHDPAHDPSAIRLADLKSWTEGRGIEWALGRITGFGNEPGDPALGGGTIPMGTG